MDMRKFSAAGVISIHALRVEGDLLPRVRHLCERRISIHALRVEGDGARGNARGGESISIHALRVEGDRPSMYDKYKYLCISIHALRVEGDPL